jgi:hypothetical protein
MMMNDVWPSDQSAHERCGFADVGIFEPMHEPGGELGGDDGGGELGEQTQYHFHATVLTQLAPEALIDKTFRSIV